MYKHLKGSTLWMKTPLVEVGLRHYLSNKNVDVTTET